MGKTKLKSVRQARVSGRRVLVTAELNVARDSRGRVVDDSRLQAVIPTLRWLRRHRARTIVATHLGRPRGRRVSGLSTRSLVGPISRAMRCTVAWVGDSVGRDVEHAVAALRPGGVLLLENTRFHPGDETNDRAYARKLSQLADVFVLESFGTAHRTHASIVGVGKYVPSYAGLRFEEEVRTLERMVASPVRPLVAILGGAKISTKLGVISRLLPRVDALLLGGALANTILQAKGIQIGRSLTESGMLRAVSAFRLTDAKLHIPVDVIVRSKAGRITRRPVGAVRRDESILDIGPDTVALFSTVIRSARSIIWNGPLGLYEERPFAAGTRAVARAVARSRAYSVAGGGETVDAIRSQHLEKSIRFLSTGGGAMVEFLEGKKLPGVELVRQI